ncbi:MAG: hypothetical protein IT452_20595 [Planctomycetia bacterium]|nr:hypothetical protein [Planctomycetia bacterium]
MLHDENLLFALYAWRVGFLTKEQVLAVAQTLRPSADVDLGKSLVKRNVMDDTQAKVLWDLVGVQQAMLGDARKAMGNVPMDDEVRAALHAAILAAQVVAPMTDKGTIDIPSPLEGGR